MTEPERREMAPSDVAAEQPTGARIFGALGLFLLTAGVVTVIAAQYGRGLFPEGAGYLFAALGLTGLMLHAARDADPEVRRLYGGFAALMLVAGVVLSVIPGPLAGGAAEKVAGYHFVPWGAGLGLLSLLFAVPFARHETDEAYRSLTQRVLLGVGGALTAGAVVAGTLKPEFLVGPGLILAILGLGFLAAYLSLVDTSEGLGYRVAIGLGVIGGVALLVAFGRSVVPTILHDGPTALQNDFRQPDKWKVAARIASILLALGVAAIGLRGQVVPWLRGVLAVVGVTVAAVFVVGSFAAPLHNPPAPFFVPYGLILGGIGVLYLAVSLGVVADTPFVVLTRRELAAYFYSPIAYIVLFGMSFSSALGYIYFASGIAQAGGAIEEPIVQRYMSLEILAAFQAMFLVPALTMRLLSEEKRTGTMEVLMTAPVNEASVVFSKFLASWIFFMLCWLPAGLYLVALRIVGGPFDYRPLLSYYLAMGCCGAAFLGMGLFFSSLTRNQIIAAVLTFSGMMFLLLTILARNLVELAPGLQAALGKLDFLSLWRTALGGQLPVQDVLVQLSFAGLWLFLTTKVLEARKWS